MGVFEGGGLSAAGDESGLAEGSSVHVIPVLVVFVSWATRCDCSVEVSALLVFVRVLCVREAVQR